MILIFFFLGQYSTSALNTEENVPCWFNLNDQIKYACKSGYNKTSGSEILTCVLNKGKAEWNGKPLNCKSMFFLLYDNPFKLTIYLII